MATRRSTSEDETLTGAAGADTFVFGPDNGDDVVVNFTDGEDLIDLSDFATISGFSDLTITSVDNGVRIDLTALGGGTILLQGADINDLNADDFQFRVNQTIEGDEGDNVLRGDTGDDTLTGGGGNDLLYGREGADTIYGGEGNDIAYGNEGDDLVEGGEGFNKLYGQEGDDTLRGGSDRDYLYGGEDDDELHGGEGHDALYGDWGTTSAGGDDTLFGGAGNDTLIGNEGNDSLDGGEGDDDLRGDHIRHSTRTTGWDDTLDGGAGNDTLAGGAGDDILSGGTGNDTFEFALGNGNDTIKDFTDGEDLIDLSGFVDIASVDELTITQDGENTVIDLTSEGGGKITLEGVTASDLDSDDFTFYQNVYTGTPYNNVLRGGAGDDTLDGGAGNDRLYGRAGDDSLDGGADDDTLDGGAGDDTMSGGTGNDTFVFAAGHGNDTIKDFTDGEDLIDLTQITGIDAFADLTITADGTTAVIDLSGHGGGEIRLENVAIGDLDEHDFSFYEQPANLGTDDM